MQGETLYKVEGSVENVVYHNENGFTVLELATDAELVTVVGEFADVAVGETLVVIGSYTGNGDSARVITLGFRPKVVAVDDMGSFSSGYELGLDGIDRSAVRVVDGGFRVAAGSLNMNESGETYRYYALG